MEQKVPDPKLFRCHRSFIVNLAQVKSVSGNAQGYRLHFSDPSITIPVSRTAGKELRGKLVHFIG
jgi:DNA-binding LytR/AlgR family response regulator